MSSSQYTLNHPRNALSWNGTTVHFVFSYYVRELSHDIFRQCRRTDVKIPGTLLAVIALMEVNGFSTRGANSMVDVCLVSSASAFDSKLA